MWKKAHQKRSTSQMFPLSFPCQNSSFLSHTSLTKTFHDHVDQKRKYDIRKAQKNSFLAHDNQYNSMIYEWRRVTTSPVVKVYIVNQDHDIDEITGENVIKNVVRAEKIVKRLTDISELSIGQSLYVFRAMLQGYESIFKKLGATTISLEKCGINEEGELKVWINQNFIRNQMSGEVLYLQSRIVSRIFQIIDVLSGPKLKNFRQHTLRNNGVWSFALMNKVIQDYVKVFRIQLPLTLKKFQNFCNINLSSLTEKNKPDSKFALSLQPSPREKPNTRSSVSFSIRPPYYLQQNSMKNQIYHVPQQKKSLPPIRLNYSHVIDSIYRKETGSIKTSTGEINFQQRAEPRKQKKTQFKVNREFSQIFIPQKNTDPQQCSCNRKSMNSQNYLGKHSQISTDYPHSNNGSRFFKPVMSKNGTVKQIDLNKSSNQQINHQQIVGKSCIEEIQNSFPQVLEQYESFQNTEWNSEIKQEEGSDNSNAESLRNTATVRKELKNKQVLISTYLQHLEGKKCQNTLANKQKPKSSFRKQDQLNDLQEALNTLLVQQKQREVLKHNSWTKKIQGLFSQQIKQLKESVSYELGQESKKRRKLGKLTQLNKWGRDVRESQIPE